MGGAWEGGVLDHGPTEGLKVSSLAFVAEFACFPEVQCEYNASE